MKKLTNEKTKIMKINGIKIRVILPQKVDVKEIPNEVNSKENRPKGLFMNF